MSSPESVTQKNYFQITDEKKSKIEKSLRTRTLGRSFNRSPKNESSSSLFSDPLKQLSISSSETNAQFRKEGNSPSRSFVNFKASQTSMPQKKKTNKEEGKEKIKAATDVILQRRKTLINEFLVKNGSIENLTKAVVNLSDSLQENATIIENFQTAIDSREKQPASLMQQIRYMNKRGSLSEAKKVFNELATKEIEIIKNLPLIGNQIERLKTLPSQYVVQFFCERTLQKIPLYYSAIAGRLSEIVQFCLTTLAKSKHPLSSKDNWKVILSHIPLSIKFIEDLSQLQDLDLALYALNQRTPPAYIEIIQMLKTKIKFSSLNLIKKELLASNNWDLSLAILKEVDMVSYDILNNIQRQMRNKCSTIPISFFLELFKQPSIAEVETVIAAFKQKSTSTAEELQFCDLLKNNLYGETLADKSSESPLQELVLKYFKSQPLDIFSQHWGTLPRALEIKILQNRSYSEIVFLSKESSSTLEVPQYLIFDLLGLITDTKTFYDFILQLPKKVYDNYLALT